MVKGWRLKKTKRKKHSDSWIGKMVLIEHQTVQDSLDKEFGAPSKPKPVNHAWSLRFKNKWHVAKPVTS